MIKYIFIVTLAIGCGKKVTQETIEGANGVAGNDGYSPRVRIVENLVSCPTGGITILTGLDLNRSNYLDVDEVEFSENVCNGTQGSKGETGESIVGPQGEKGDKGDSGQDGADAVVELVDPCGDASGIYDEVLLKLGDGTLLASFSDNVNGQNTRFSVLTPGSYVTTDGSNCHFTVNEDYDVE